MSYPQVGECKMTTTRQQSTSRAMPTNDYPPVSYNLSAIQSLPLDLAGEYGGQIFRDIAFLQQLIEILFAAIDPVQTMATTTHLEGFPSELLKIKFFLRRHA